MADESVNIVFNAVDNASSAITGMRGGGIDAQPGHASRSTDRTGREASI